MEENSGCGCGCLYYIIMYLIIVWLIKLIARL